MPARRRGALDYLEPFVKPGVTTNELDKLAHDYMVDVQGCIPAPLNYAPTRHAYPRASALGQPRDLPRHPERQAAEEKGDIVNVDITTIKNGWHGDTSRMFIVGEASSRQAPVPDHLRGDVEGHRGGAPGRAAGRHRPCDPDLCREGRLFGGTRVLRPRHRRKFHEDRRCCTTAGPAPASSSRPA